MKRIHKIVSCILGGVLSMGLFAGCVVENTGANKAPDGSQYMVDWEGNCNPLYYTVQNCNKELQFYAQALKSFRYQGVNYQVKAPLPAGNAYVSNITKNDLKYISDYSFTIKHQSGGMALITELYDAERDPYGYFVVNTTDPAYPSEMEVTLKVKDFKNVQIWQNTAIHNVAVADDGTVKVHLGTGRGAFVMLY